MILVLTGNGKGKTTGALGTALRAAGWHKKTALVFFDKGGSHYGEQNSLETLSGRIDVFRFGLPRFDAASKTFRFDNVPGDFKQAEAALTKVSELLKAGYFLVVADELINALRLGLVKEAAVRELLEQCPAETHLMLTGRDAPEWLMEKADLVSEIGEVKHYFQKGVGAIKGIDF